MFLPTEGLLAGVLRAPGSSEHHIHQRVDVMMKPSSATECARHTHLVRLVSVTMPPVCTLFPMPRNR